MPFQEKSLKVLRTATGQAVALLIHEPEPPNGWPKEAPLYCGSANFSPAGSGSRHSEDVVTFCEMHTLLRGCMQ